MIISHRHRYIFFAIPKTGTHSVRQALREHMDGQDLEQVGLFVTKRFPFPEFRDISHGHLSARQIRPVLGDAVYESYTKFAFVRNPYERFVSYCAFMARDTPHFDNEPTRYMKFVLQKQPLDHILFVPQSDLVTGADGRVELDIVGRNETMQASYDQICARIGIPSASLGRSNASRHRAYQEYYDAELRGAVSRLYQRDLDNFGYAFD